MKVRLFHHCLCCIPLFQGFIFMFIKTRNLTKFTILRMAIVNKIELAC